MHIHKRPREDTVKRQPLQYEKGEVSRETSPASALTLNYQPPEVWENELLLLSKKKKKSMEDRTYIGSAIFGKYNQAHLGL